MPGLQLHQDGSLTLMPESPGDAERLRKMFQTAHEHEAAIAAGLATVELVLKIGFRCASDAAKAALLRQAAPTVAGGKLISTGPTVARGG